MKPIVKGLVIGCGSLAVLSLIGVVILVGWLASGNEGGVRLGNEMEQYALDYIADHGLLKPDEEILAYYDVTLSLDSTEAAILTTERIGYHKQGSTSWMPIEEIEDVRHRKEPFLGDILEVQGTSGRTLKIEIAPLNNGETFKNVLMANWQKRREAL